MRKRSPLSTRDAQTKALFCVIASDERRRASQPLSWPRATNTQAPVVPFRIIASLSISKFSDTGPKLHLFSLKRTK